MKMFWLNVKSLLEMPYLKSFAVIALVCAVIIMQPCDATCATVNLPTPMEQTNHRFKDNGDQTITDNLTGLVWAKDANIMASRNPEFDFDDIPADGKVTWRNALDYIKKLNSENYLGFNDWRLPNIHELMSIVNFHVESEPYQWLHNQGFLNMQPDYYWSSTGDTMVSSRAWKAFMKRGDSGPSLNTLFEFVLPVRGGDWSSGLWKLWQTGKRNCNTGTSCGGNGEDGELRFGEDWPSPRFTVNEDYQGEAVTDNLTGLIWTKDVFSPGPSSCGSGGLKSWAGANSYIACLNSNNYLGHNDWRLPTVHELMSLVSYGDANPALPKEHPFINAKLSASSTVYWSAMTVQRSLNQDYAWALEFSAGMLSSYNKTLQQGFTAWPVRSEQRASVAPLTVDFGVVAVDSTQHQTISLKNTGSKQLAVIGATLTGDSASFLTITPQTCSSLTPTLQPGETCTIDLAYSPLLEGNHLATLTIASDAPSNPIMNIPIKGQGTVQPAAELAGLVIKGSNYVLEGTSERYRAYAVWDNGASTEVSGQWSVESNGVATIGGEGILNTNTIGADAPVTITATYTHKNVIKSAVMPITVYDSARKVVNFEVIDSGSLYEGGSVQYRAQVTWNNGTISIITANWSLDSTTFATITNAGLLTAKQGSNGQAITVTASYLFRGGAYTAQKTKTIIPFPLSEWEVRRSFYPSSISLLDIACDGRAYVSSSNGELINSLDLNSWNRFKLGTMSKVKLLNGTFVAYGSSDKIAVSKDGKSFKTLTPAWTGVTVKDVTWDNGKYFAVASEANGADYVLSSSDGYSWHIDKINNFTYEFVAVAAGNNVVVAAGSDGSNYVFNGSWVQSMPGFVIGQLEYGNGRFIALSGTTIKMSFDGINWSDRLTGYSGVLSFVNNMIILLDKSKNKLLTSYDGYNWNIVSSSVSSFNGICHDGTQYLAIGNGVLKTSVDAITWTSIFNGKSVDEYLTAIFPQSGRWFAAGYGGLILAADSSKSWQNVSSGTANIIRAGTAYSGGLIFGGDRETILTSVDGSNWINQYQASGGVIGGFAAGAGYVIAVGANGRILTSADGLSWVPTTSGVTSALNAVTYAAAKYIAVGDGGVIIAGASPSVWTVRTSGITTSLRAVTYGGNLFVTVGDGGKILTSSDGITWTVRTSGTLSKLNALAYGNGYFVAVGDGGVLLTSPDGISWTSRDSRTKDNLYAVAYNTQTFVAVGGWGTVVESGFFGSFQPLVTGAPSTSGTSDSFSLGVEGADIVGYKYKIDSGTYSNELRVTDPLVISSLSHGTHIISIIAKNKNGDWLSDQYATKITIIVDKKVEPFSIANINPYDTTSSSTIRLSGNVEVGSKVTVRCNGISGNATIDGGSWSYTISGLLIGDNMVEVVAIDMHGNVSELKYGLVYDPNFSAPYDFQWVQPLYGSHDLNSLVVGSSGLIVAVGDSATILTSNNGTDWQLRYRDNKYKRYRYTSPPKFNKVMFAGGQYVAVGELVTATSQDGIVWDVRDFTDRLQDVCFANSLYVAVGSSGQLHAIFTSSDGKQWTKRYSGVSSGLLKVLYFKNRFLAIGHSGALVVSTDGTTWTSIATGTTSSLYDAASNDNNVVIVGAGGTVLTSVDGVVWNKQTSNTSNLLYSILYAGNRYVSVGSNGTVLLSFDGITWTAGSSGMDNVFLRFIRYLDGRYIAGSYDYIYLSMDGTTWQGRYTGSTGVTIKDALSKNSTLVLIGTGGSVSISTDYIVYNNISLSRPLYSYNSALCTPGKFMALGNYGKILSSADGVTWSSVSSGTTNTLRASVIVNGKYVAVGDAGTIITSIDGVAWTAVATGNTSDFKAVAYGNSKSVVVGSAGVILTSADGQAWVSQSSGTTNKLNSVAYGAGKFICVGDSGTILVSGDGINWIFVPSGITSNLHSVAYGNSGFVAVGINGIIITSTDGFGWITYSSETAQTLYAVMYRNDHYLAIGYLGETLVSFDAKNWMVNPTEGGTNLYASCYSGENTLLVGDKGSLLLSNKMSPILNVKPYSLKFTNSEITGLQAVPITISNAGLSLLSVTDIGITGADAAKFSITADTCSNLTPTLAPGVGCRFNINLIHETCGTVNAALNIKSNSSINPNHTITIYGVLGTCQTFKKLVVDHNGNGEGAVTSSPTGIACTGSRCTALFEGSSSVTLYASPSSNSLFNGWSGDCTGIADCSVLMDRDRSVVATFITYLPVRITGVAPTYYGSFLEALTAASVGSAVTLHAQGGDFQEGFSLTKDVAIILKGGYDGGYSTQNGTTVLRGEMVIGRGSVVVENLVIQ